jgi:hypothetical protein
MVPLLMDLGWQSAGIADMPICLKARPRKLNSK